MVERRVDEAEVAGDGGGGCDGAASAAEVDWEEFR